MYSRKHNVMREICSDVHVVPIIHCVVVWHNDISVSVSGNALVLITDVSLASYFRPCEGY